MRNMDARYYSPAQCVGQLAENSAAKGSQFNATTFQVSVLSDFDSFLRTTGSDYATKIPTQALKALDDGVGFRYEEVQDMMTYGTPENLSASKKFGKAFILSVHGTVQLLNRSNLHMTHWQPIDSVSEHALYDKGVTCRAKQPRPQGSGSHPQPRLLSSIQQKQKL